MTTTDEPYLLIRHGACKDAVAWAATQPDYRTAWHACERGDWLLWAAGRAGVDQRLLMLAACQCARRALQYLPPGEARPLAAIEAAERWTRGEATREALAAAYACARAAAYAGAYAGADAAAHAAARAAAYAAAYACADAAAYAAAYAGADAAAYAAARAAAYAAARAAARAAAYAGAYAGADAAAHAAESRAQADLVRGIISWDAVAAGARK